MTKRHDPVTMRETIWRYIEQNCYTPKNAVKIDVLVGIFGLKRRQISNYLRDLVIHKKPIHQNRRDRTGIFWDDDNKRAFQAIRGRASAIREENKTIQNLVACHALKHWKAPKPVGDETIYELLAYVIHKQCQGKTRAKPAGELLDLVNETIEKKEQRINPDLFRYYIRQARSHQFPICSITFSIPHYYWDTQTPPYPMDDPHDPYQQFLHYLSTACRGKENAVTSDQLIVQIKITPDGNRTAENKLRLYVARATQRGKYPIQSLTTNSPGYYWPMNHEDLAECITRIRKHFHSFSGAYRNRKTKTKPPTND